MNEHEYVVRCHWGVNIYARDLARHVHIRVVEVLASFERDAMGLPEYTSTFHSEAADSGTPTGTHVIEFEAPDLGLAWAIWTLGCLNHPHLTWSLRRNANAADFAGIEIPDYC